MNIRQTIFVLIVLLAGAGSARAVPETVSVRVTDVTTTSFAVVWLTDVAAEPTVEVYRDPSMGQPLGGVEIVPMADTSPAVREAARGKGIMKVRVSGLMPETTCWVRTVTDDPANPGSVSYSSLREVTTAGKVVPYRRGEDGSLVEAANALLPFRVYIRPADPAELPGQGDLLLLEAADAGYPLSSFVGEGTVAPEGILDLNNLFALDGSSLDLLGGEKVSLRIYRGGTLSTLLHYRRLPAENGLAVMAGPVRGFFADVNLDGRVDETDFTFFREQYRQGADDGVFNPDFNFIAVEEMEIKTEDRIDARDFARFATQYGRTDVE